VEEICAESDFASLGGKSAFPLSRGRGLTPFVQNQMERGTKAGGQTGKLPYHLYLPQLTVGVHTRLTSVRLSAADRCRSCRTTLPPPSTVPLRRAPASDQPLLTRTTQGAPTRLFRSWVLVKSCMELVWPEGWRRAHCFR
jgi:hypothetical protein